MQSSNKKFHLSIVATSRNDNHGGSLTKRMQHFVDGFVQQCIRHNLNAELILVEWNPPAENPPLVEALTFPKDLGPCAIRIITVPSEFHTKLKHSDKFPLFQMIAKNVGIRRALGKHVLATNIDILFSDQIIRFIKKNLKDNVLYRADRLDIPSEIPKTSDFDELLLFCQNNAFRANTKFGTFFIENFMLKKHSLKYYFKKVKSLTGLPLNEILSILFKKIPSKILKILFPSIAFNQTLHTNACGDFTLLSYNNWERLRGYPEWEIFSWHLDSVLLFQANKNCIKEIDLPINLPIYHIEHSLGSGYTHEAANVLFDRLDKQKIPYLSNNDLDKLINTMKTNKKHGVKTVYNDMSWGFGNQDFKETWISNPV